MAGRVIVLLLLIAVLALGGIVWFDYLNVIDAKTVLAPVYRYIPFIKGAGRTQPKIEPNEMLNLDAERLAVRLEALELERMEMETFKRDMDSRYGEIEQMAQELEERQGALDEREETLRALAAETNTKDGNVEWFARNLNGMPPNNAVAILAMMEDQNIIDILRKTEEIAQAEGTSSIVSYWLSLMEPQRAAELQRKMVNRPAN